MSAAFLSGRFREGLPALAWGRSLRTEPVKATRTSACHEMKALSPQPMSMLRSLFATWVERLSSSAQVRVWVSSINAGFQATNYRAAGRDRETEAAFAEMSWRQNQSDVCVIDLCARTASRASEPCRWRFSGSCQQTHIDEVSCNPRACREGTLQVHQDEAYGPVSR